MAIITIPQSSVDPTDILLQYVQEVKPYHSKVLDVIVEYVVTDVITTTIKENFSFTIGLQSVEREIERSCGYGMIWDPYSGTLPANLPTANIVSATAGSINQFVASMPTQTPLHVIVTNTKSNQMTLVTPYLVNGVNSTLQQWKVSGNVALELNTGSVIYITSNPGAGANGKYTVSSTSYNFGTNTTTVTVVEPISIAAVGSGRFNIPTFSLVTGDTLPYWPPGAAIVFTTTGTLPGGMTAGTTYYYAPSKQYGYFNLSKVRYPTSYTDLVDFANGGSAELTVVRSEPFVPGEYTIIAGTADNDGNYTVNTITAQGSDFLISVYERVPNTDGAGGTITYQGSWGDEYCPVTHGPDLLAETYITERLQFDFGPAPSTSFDPPQYDVTFV